jgi:hypothetical protein
MPHVPFPAVEESAEVLLDLRRAESDERRRERLHALWLVASGAVGSRLTLAGALGRNRETVSRWRWPTTYMAVWLRCCARRTAPDHRVKAASPYPSR